MELILLVAAIAVAWLVFTALIRIVKTTVKTAFSLAAILFLLLALGIGPDQLWQKIAELPKLVQDLLSN